MFKETIATISLPFTLSLSNEELTWFAKEELKKIAPEWSITTNPDTCTAAVEKQNLYNSEEFIGVVVYQAHCTVFTGSRTVHINKIP